MREILSMDKSIRIKLEHGKIIVEMDAPEDFTQEHLEQKRGLAEASCGCADVFHAVKKAFFG